jgi:hypothetical protein
MTTLQTRFPITFSKCKKHNEKYKKYEPNIITSRGIVYDKSVIPILRNDEIERFIDLQIKYPEIINNCFDKLIEILEQQEKQETQVITRQNKKMFKENSPIKQIYELLININEHKNNRKIIDNWILFIKSQNEFSKFF